jgi:hypothetical protein
MNNRDIIKNNLKLLNEKRPPPVQLPDTAIRPANTVYKPVLKKEKYYERDPVTGKWVVRIRTVPQNNPFTGQQQYQYDGVTRPIPAPGPGSGAEVLPYYPSHIIPTRAQHGTYT